MKDALKLLATALTLVCFVAPAASEEGPTADSPVIDSGHSQAELFELVYIYAFGGPFSSRAMTCAAIGPTDAIGNLDAAVVDELNTMVPAEGADWEGFVPFNRCAEIEANQGKIDGVRVGFTSMINTGAPEIDTGHDDLVHMFLLKRYCGPGCGGHDWMTVYKVRDGYVLISGTPRFDPSGDLYYEAVD